jgi:hypothetical protein
MSTAGKQVNKLTSLMTFQLMQLIQNDYTKSGLSDQQFADEAGKKLGFPVTYGNVQGAREQLSITNNFSKGVAAPDYKALMDRIAHLEEEVAMLIRAHRHSQPIGSK